MLVQSSVLCIHRIGTWLASLACSPSRDISILAVCTTERWLNGHLLRVGEADCLRVKAQSHPVTEVGSDLFYLARFNFVFWPLDDVIERSLDARAGSSGILNVDEFRLICAKMQKC